MKPALRTALIALCVAGATLTAVAPAASATARSPSTSTCHPPST